MVQVIERNPQEISLTKKKSELEQIAATLVGKGNIQKSQDCFTLYSNSILVIPEINTLVVYDPKKFNLSMKLAELYEKCGNDEFEVRKQF